MKQVLLKQSLNRLQIKLHNTTYIYHDNNFITLAIRNLVTKENVRKRLF